MSERHSYPAGVPCWVTNLQHDVPAARDFYAELFGWEMETGPDDVAPYALGRLRGRDIAAIGTLPGPDTPPAWVTEVRTDDLAATVAAVRGAGGQVLRRRSASVRSGSSGCSSTRAERRSAPGRRVSARERSWSTSRARGR